MLLGVAGCLEFLGPSCTNGTSELSIALVPRVDTLSVGETLIPTLSLRGSCGPIKETVAWASPDTQVVSVHPQTGLITAKTAGTAAVRATGERFGFIDEATIVVAPPE